MRKRTQQKIKKIARKSLVWAFAAGLVCLSVYHSIDTFIQLHNGASLKAISGHRYSPVITETIILVIITLVALMALKLITKWRNSFIVLTGIIIYSLIGWFSYWVFIYTRQNPAEGLITIGVILTAVVMSGALLLLLESYVRRKRKSVRGRRNPLVRLSTTIERLKTYECMCGRGGNITLGIRWVKWVNIGIAAATVTLIALSLMVGPALIVAVIFITLFAWSYTALFRSMQQHRHSSACSHRCARIGIWYQLKGSTYYIRDPKKPARKKQ